MNDNLLDYLPFKTQLNFLKQNLNTKKAYLVGGVVRDLLLGAPINDLDIEVYNLSQKEFEANMRQLGAVGVGRAFFVYKLNDIDISLPRVESKTGLKHNDFSVSVTQDEFEASARRDFRVNSMMIDIFSGELVDCHGGYEDLQNNLLRYIDKDKFCEDQLRVLRAVQFCARFGFEIERDTLELMKSLDLQNLSKARIFWELEKLFFGTHYEQVLLYMYELNLFEKLFCVSVSIDKLKELSQILEKNKNFILPHLKKFYWLYFAKGLLGLNLEKLELPNEYKKKLKMPFLSGEISDSELKMVAYERPLCEWVGTCQDGVEVRAKELDIYDKKYNGGVKIEDVLKDGFVGSDISVEYKRRVLGTL